MIRKWFNDEFKKTVLLNVATREMHSGELYMACHVERMAEHNKRWISVNKALRMYRKGKADFCNWCMDIFND